MGKATKPYVHLIRVSTTRLDGGTLFGATAKQQWERFVLPDRQNRVSIGNYIVLIRHEDGWVLVNTGPGDKPPLSLDAARTRSRSSLIRELKQIGLMPKDIVAVIQTDLFSEYAGGCTHFTSSGRVLPTFPNARYIVHKDALEEAMRPSRRNRHRYRTDDIEPLLDSEQLEVVDRTTKVCSGVWVEPAAGPTPGHQIVLCQQGRATYAFLGMLVPTSMHLSPTVNAAYDWNPEATARTKIEVKRQAEVESWLVAPVGRDEWVRAGQLESIESFSLGRTELPLPAKTRRVATPTPAASSTPATPEPAVTPQAPVPA